MLDICTTCLSTNRKLFQLKDLSYIYECVVANLAVYPQPLICWECRALLKKCIVFRGRAAAANETLNNISRYYMKNSPAVLIESLSRLKQCPLKSLECCIEDNQDDTENAVQAISGQLLENPEVEIKEERCGECEIDIPFSPDACDPLSDTADIENDTKLSVNDLEDMIPITRIGNTSDPLSETADVGNDIKLTVKKPDKPIKVTENPGLVALNELMAKTGKGIRQIKVPSEVAKQLELLQNKSVQVKVGNTVKKLIVMKKINMPNLNTKSVETNDISMSEVNKIVSSEELVSKTGELNKDAVSDKLEQPADEDIKTTFSTILSGAISKDMVAHVGLRFLSEEECKSQRDSCKNNPDFVTAQFKCTDCILAFTNLELLKEHYDNNHVERADHTKCTACSCYIPDHKYSYHYGRHRVRYICLLCAFNCMEVKDLRRHMQKHTPGKKENVDKKTKTIIDVGSDEFIAKVKPGGLSSVKRKLKTTSLRKNLNAPLPQKPTEEQIIKRFSVGVKNMVPESLCKSVQVRVMSDEEMNALREARKLEAHYANSAYKCEDCIVGYYSKQLLEDHVKAKHCEESSKNSLRTKCDVCKTLIPDEMYAFHYGRHRVLYECLLCNNTETEPKRLRAHMNLHRGDRSVKHCRQCNVEFTSKYHLRVHKSREHGNTEQFTCHVCGKTFEHSWSFKDHIRRHVEPSKPVECTICHKVYKNAATLAVHCRNIHMRTEKENYRCEECKKNFVNIQCLNMHMKYSRKHVDPTKFRHICDACGKGFMFERLMKDHIDFVHHGITEYVCRYCNKMCSSAGGLRKHMRFVHEGATYAKNKVCNVCGKKFTSPKSLREHQNIHNGTRPFKCPICGDTFKQSAALYTHRRLVHQGFKVRNKKLIKCD